MTDAVGSSFGSPMANQRAARIQCHDSPLVSAHPSSSISGESDCLRAVPQSNSLGFEYRYLPASFAPRPRLERGTYCLGGTFEVWLEGAGCCLTCHSAHMRMAGCGLTSPCSCGRWLPVWLPEILLVMLTFGCPGHDAGAGSSPYNMPRLADRVQPRAHAAAGRSGRAPCIGRPVRSCRDRLRLAECRVI